MLCKKDVTANKKVTVPVVTEPTTARGADKPVFLHEHL